MDEVMTIRDPSHAATLTPDALQGAIEHAGLRVVARREVAREGLVSDWMWPGEFPEERIAAVNTYVAGHWRGLGLGVLPDGDGYTYIDRWMMFLAVHA